MKNIQLTFDRNKISLSLKQFQPNLIMISAGYDAAYGCPLVRLRSFSIYFHLEFVHF